MEYDSVDLLKNTIIMLEQQRMAERERIRQTILASTVPLPDPLVQEIARMRHEDCREVLTAHPGCEIWERRESYRFVWNLFQQCVKDLNESIDIFEQHAQDQTLFYRTRREKLDKLSLVVNKELFTTLTVSHALVDHCTRRLQKSVKVRDFELYLDETIRNDGLQAFMMGLRTVLHHLRMFEADWNVTYKIGVDPESKFTWDRLTLIAIASEILNKKPKLKHQMKAIIEYAKTLPMNINIRDLINLYSKRLEIFHNWYLTMLSDERVIGPKIVDYERCLLEQKRTTTRTFWKVMMGNWLRWESPPNPYNHLHQFLSSRQLEEISPFVPGSREQVDRIIEMVDAEGACDEELRAQFYQLFARAQVKAAQS